jgi:hypothetical protein
MSLLRPILVAVVALALAGYAVDCAPMASADEAMQCCETMPCDSHSVGHSQDCCQTMPSMHGPFLQAPSVHAASFSAVAVSTLPVAGYCGGVDSTAHVTATHCESPSPPDSPNSLPLRI